MPDELTELEFFPDDETGGRRLAAETVGEPTQGGPMGDNEVDEAALAKLWQKGREAWRGVPSATEWVESLRGH